MRERVVAAASHLACIIGWPVEQSLSPAIHNAAFDALALDWTYIAMAVRPDGAADGVGLLRELGVEGANVTMPHKRTVVPFLDAVEGDAWVTGAVNTIVRDGALLIGKNTDGDGFVEFLRADAGVDPAGKRALVLGAGGAARAAVVALHRAGADVVVAARRIEQAHEVAELAEGARAIALDDVGPADLVVNATPARDGLPLERLGFGPGVTAVDMIYPPPPTPFVQAAQAAGAAAFDGLGMLVHQAALSFRLWTGVDAPLTVMRRAAETALSRPEPGQIAPGV